MLNVLGIGTLATFEAEYAPDVRVFGTLATVTSGEVAGAAI